MAGNLTFTVPPEPTQNPWGIWYKPGGGGGTLPSAVLSYGGMVDVTQPFTPPPLGPPLPGSTALVQVTGTPDPSWPLNAPPGILAKDTLLVWDGRTLNTVPYGLDASAYVAKAGATMDEGAALTFQSPPGSHPTIIHGDGGVLDAVSIDMGTY